MQKRARYEENDIPRLFACHLAAVALTDTRPGLIEVWKAAKISLPTPLLVAMVVTAIRERLAGLENDGTISN